jgi:hypothetical protein
MEDTSPANDFDGPWKEALDQYFEAFLAFFFPAAHAEIDWSRGYESLNTEFRAIVREAETGRRSVDKLVKVWAVVLAHVKAQETQHNPEQRRAWKLWLIKSLFSRGLTRTDIESLFRLIDWFLHMPPAENRKFWTNFAISIRRTRCGT